MALSFKEVAEIIRIIDASNCEELVLESEGTRLVVRRGISSDTHAGVSPGLPAQSEPASTKDKPKAAANPVSGEPASGSGDTSDVVTENSPMVGTFYRRPSPDEAPYVEVGTKVSVGDPLCMIEVMKLYTTIAASVSGVIESIIADEASLVEFDQPLFVIRPS